MRLSALLTCGLFGCHAAPPEPAPAPVKLAAGPAPTEPDAGSEPSAPAEVPRPDDDAPLGMGMKWSDLVLRRKPIVVTGRATPVSIERVLLKKMGSIHACIGMAKPRGITRVTVVFTIDPAGSVADGAKTNSEPQDATLADCVTRQIVPLSFPKPEAGTVSVTCPLVATRSQISQTAPPKGKPSGGELPPGEYGVGRGAGSGEKPK